MVVPGRRRTALPAALLAAAALCLAGCEGAEEGDTLVVGSKVFTESVILGEIVSQLIESSGHRAIHRRQLGGTQILWNALRGGEIDLYPEYTGTLREEIFRDQAIPDATALARAAAGEGMRLSGFLGFNNTYAIGVKPETARRLGLETISDLRRHPRLRLGFSNEFMDRKDGWPGLRVRYGLPQTDVRGLDHDLSYRALDAGDIAATDLYSTDAEIRFYGLRLLEDDLGHFPRYEALLLYRGELEARAPKALEALRRLEGRISAEQMVELNAAVKLDREKESAVATRFLRDELGVDVAPVPESRLRRVLERTGEHLVLVVVSLGSAIVLAIPLGILAARRRRIGAVILSAVGLIQTIPALALLVFMIPLLGIGAPPAIVALFLYSLLPIVRNTTAGIRGIPPDLVDSAKALGLPQGARLGLVELPMASPAILAGVKTSAVINVGTATLGALIGAGGYGQPILTGIRLADVSLILEGAVPAALLALLVQGLFDLSERWLVPRGLRISAGS